MLAVLQFRGFVFVRCIIIIIIYWFGSLVALLLFSSGCGFSSKYQSRRALFRDALPYFCVSSGEKRMLSRCVRIYHNYGCRPRSRLPVCELAKAIAARLNIDLLTSSSISLMRFPHKNKHDENLFFRSNRLGPKIYFFRLLTF
jgi:hypothetical protein